MEDVDKVTLLQIELNNKIIKEYDDFIEKIKALEPDKIIEKSYEITMKREFVSILTEYEIYANLEEKPLRDLIKKENLLDRIYDVWRFKDGYGLPLELIEDCINEAADIIWLENEYEEKNKHMQ